MENKIAIFWFRRDLRLEDNVGLCHALQSGFPVLPVFIFNADILILLQDKKDRRVDFIHQAAGQINLTLKKHQTKLTTFLGKPYDIFKALDGTYDIQGVFCNRDYEPQAIERDTEIYRFFKNKNIPFRAYKDQVIFDENDILKNDGSPYTVYTPYAKKWRETLQESSYRSLAMDFEGFYRQPFSNIFSLEDMGFESTDTVFETPVPDASIIGHYDRYRDYPALPKTIQWGTAFRFGVISIRKCVTFAPEHNQMWLSELIWREFFMQILYHFPYTVHHSFKKKYDLIPWRNDEGEFHLWCEGRTGYPIGDAGIRQLNQTGYMHNRVRMIAASFLCKHLLIDWRWGEAYFAQKLNDYDLSASNGNCQWVAGSGCDAAPYFRVFNPAAQTEKFDKDLEYVKKWLPEYGTKNYSAPIVEHAFARARAIATYNGALKEKEE